MQLYILLCYYDDVIKWKHFLRHWPFVRGIPSQRPVTALIFFYLRLNKRMSKQSRRRWFDTLLRSLWRHCNALHRGGGFWFWCWERYNMVRRSKVQWYWGPSGTLQTSWLGTWGLWTSWGCWSEVFLSIYCDWKKTFNNVIMACL